MALVVMPISLTIADFLPAANIGNCIPFAEVEPYSMCISMANPEVASATAAAFGVLIPMPCTPITTSPWIPGAINVLLGGLPALVQGCMLICDYAGVIMIEIPIAFNVEIL